MVDDQQQQPQQNGVAEVTPTTFKGEDLLSKWTPEEREARKQEIIALAQAYTYFTGRNDRFRHEEASDYGGFWLLDDNQTSILRSAITEIIGVSRETHMNINHDSVLLDCWA